MLTTELDGLVECATGDRNGLGVATPHGLQLVPNVTGKGEVSVTLKFNAAGSLRIAHSLVAFPDIAAVSAQPLVSVGGSGDMWQSGTIVTLTPGQTAYLGVVVYEKGDGSSLASSLLQASITHYLGDTSIEGVQTSSTPYRTTLLLTARNADESDVKIHYRTVPASSPSDSYTSPTPIDEAGFTIPPHNISLTIDRGISDRLLEVWAESLDGTFSPIARVPLSAITASDQTNALTTLVVTPSFTTCTPGNLQTGHLKDTIAWTNNSPFPVKLSQCQGSGCSLPGATVADPATSGTQYDFGPGYQSGVGGTGAPMRRKYRAVAYNSYGETIDTEDTTEQVTQYADCN